METVLVFRGCRSYAAMVATFGGLHSVFRTFGDDEFHFSLSFKAQFDVMTDLFVSPKLRSGVACLESPIQTS